MRAPDALRLLGGPLGGVAIDDNTIYTPAFSVADAPIWSIQLEWTGDPASTVTLWASNKPHPDESTDDDWVQDGDYTGPTIAGSPGKHLEEIGNSGAKFYRLKIVTTDAGSGTMSAWVHGKSSRSA